MTAHQQFAKVLILITSLELIVGCSKTEVPFSELVLRDGVYFPKFSDTPFNGEVTGSVVAGLKDGRFHGQVLRYDEQGNLLVRQHYLNGVLHGLRETYLNGKKDSHMPYKNGFLHGLVITPSYFGDWEIEREVVFVDGMLHGPYIVRTGGRTFFETNFVEHKISSDRVDLLDENGSVEVSIPFIDGKIEGIVRWKNGCSQSFLGGVGGKIKRPPPSTEQMSKKAETGSNFDYMTMCVVLTPIPEELANPGYVWGDGPSVE